MTVERLANFVFGGNVISWALLGLFATTEAGGLSLPRICISAIQFTVGTLFFFRSPIKCGPNAVQLATAIPSLCACGLIFRFAEPLHTWPHHASLLFATGATFAIISLLSLGANFAVLPALRQVTTRWPYTWMRHPAYTGETVMAVACVVAVPSWSMAAILPILIVAVVLRIHHEEQLLRSSTSYVDYCRTTRWRMLPGVW